jgi:cation:H+ antiporter
MAVSLAWAAFLMIVGVIGAAGYHMCRAADDIAEISGWSRAWIGLLLLSIATSLPELVTGVSAVAVFDTPNLAIGDALGSCVFNLVMLVVLELVAPRGEPLYARAGTGHVVSAAFGVILTGIVAFSILVAPDLPGFRVGHVGLYSLLILGAYVAAMYTVFHYERRTLLETQVHEPLIPGVEDRSLSTALGRYTVSALFVAAAGVALPRVGVEIATLMGWSDTFVGTVFVALATSVPEVAVSIAAMTLGSVDLAVANLLGSNLFDVAIVAIDDFVYTPGPILNVVSSSHAVTALSAAIMSATAVVGFSYRPHARLLRRSSWIGATLVSVYLLNAIVQFLAGE